MIYTDLEHFMSQNGYEIDGSWYPRVTSIVSIKAKPALYRFYANHVNFAAAEAMMNRSAEEGTQVHEIAEAILAKKTASIPQQLKNLFDEFNIFLEQHEIVPIGIEQKIISKKHGYAGTIDVLAQVDGKVGVLDIKTSQAIYRDYGVQTAAYVEALHEDKNMPSLTRWILRLDQTRLCLNGCGARIREKGGHEKIKNGYGYKSKNCAHTWGPHVADIELKELHGLDKDTKAFLAAKTLWEWEHDEWLSQIAPKLI